MTAFAAVAGALVAVVEVTGDAIPLSDERDGLPFDLDVPFEDVPFDAELEPAGLSLVLSLFCPGAESLRPCAEAEPAATLTLRRIARRNSSCCHEYDGDPR